MIKYIFISLLGVAWLAAGCGSLPTQAAPTHIPPTRSPVATSVEIETNTPSIVPDKVTPQPTLSYEVQDHLYTLLGNNGNCDLPCYWGIVPGKTLWTNAETILEPYAYKVPITYDRTRSTSTNAAYGVSILTTKDIDLEMFIAIDVGRNGVVTDIISHVEFWGYTSNYYDKHLLRYSISEVFRRNGKPDAVFFGPDLQGGSGYVLDVVYENPKLAFEITGRLQKDTNDEYRICPNLGDGDIGNITIAVANPSDPIDVKTLIGAPFWQDVPPVEKTSGMTLNDFYNLMVSDKQPACFLVKPSP